MKVSNCAARRVAVFAIVAALAGCAGWRSSTGPSNAIPDAAAMRDTASLKVAAKRSALLYVSDADADTVFVYSYPALKPVTSLAGLNSPTGMCVDPATGNVWITETSATASGVVEFTHGGTKPIRTLQIGGDNNADACAVNPTNGEVAVANATFGGDDPGNVIIFNVRTGKSKTYSDRGMFYVSFIGYDGAGNLFVDGTPSSYNSTFRLDELPRGGNKLVNIHWHGPKIEYPGNVQYDGTSVTVGDMQKALIYQTAGGKVVGTTVLDGACDVEQYFIDRDKVIVPSYCNNAAAILVYNYPDGGAPIKTITGFSFAFGSAISR